MTNPLPTPRFSADELWNLEDDARNALLNEDGALSDPGRWLGHVIDLSRALRSEIDHRLHG